MEKEKKEVPIWEKANLTVEEATLYFNIGKDKVRELTDRKDCDFVLFCGRKKLIKRKRMEEYLNNAYSI